MTELLAAVGGWLATFIPVLVAKYPIATTILLVMGALRAVLKPIIAALRAYVTYTPNPADDAILDKVEQSAPMKAVMFALDWFASIKPLDPNK